MKIKYIILNIILLIIFLFIFSVIRLNTENVTYYENDDEFYWEPSSDFYSTLRNHEPDIILNKDIKTEDDAIKCFSNYIKDSEGILVRIMNNKYHIKYDDTLDAYILYYEGFFMLNWGIFGVIYQDSNEMYILHMKF